MKRLVLVLIGALSAGCGHSSSQAPVPTTKPELPLPVQALGGAKVPIFPLVTLVVEPGTGWDAALTDRSAALRRVDSIVRGLAQERAPEVSWVGQDAVRRAATQAPGLLTDPDRLATRQLKRHASSTIPEPLRAQLRQLAGVAAGGRYAFVPAELMFVRDSATQRSYADFSIVLADVRLGAISWSDTMRGTGDTPWEAVAAAVRTMFP